METTPNYRCTVCGYGKGDHDPETGRMPSDVVGCACGRTCQYAEQASRCPVTKHHTYHPDPEWGEATA